MADAKSPERFSLKRWSRRKLDSARVLPADSREGEPPSTRTVPFARASEPTAELVRADPVAGAPDAAPTTAVAPAVGPPLPPVDSLTFDSDFRGFLQPKVDEAVKRAALKKLFSDPRFNVMDRLDVYIDDYSLPDPLPREWLKELASAQNILNPPQTRVNDQGFAEDVLPERAEAESALRQAEGNPPAIDTVAAPMSSSDDTTPVAPMDAPSAVDPAQSSNPRTVDRSIAIDPSDTTSMLVANTKLPVEPAPRTQDSSRSPVPRKPA